MCILFNLPTEILVMEVLSGLCGSLSDLARLDTAVTNHIFRNIFLAVAQDMRLNNTQSRSKTFVPLSLSCLAWIDLRHISCSELTFDSNAFHQANGQLKISNLSFIYVESLKIKFDIPTSQLSLMVNSCPNLKRLCYAGHDSGSRRWRSQNQSNKLRVCFSPHVLSILEEIDCVNSNDIFHFETLNLIAQNCHKLQRCLLANLHHDTDILRLLMNIMQHCHDAQSVALQSAGGQVVELNGRKVLYLRGDSSSEPPASSSACNMTVTEFFLQQQHNVHPYCFDHVNIPYIEVSHVMLNAMRNCCTSARVLMFDWCEFAADVTAQDFHRLLASMGPTLTTFRCTAMPDCLTSDDLTCIFITNKLCPLLKSLTIASSGYNIDGRFTAELVIGIMQSCTNLTHRFCMRLYVSGG